MLLDLLNQCKNINSLQKVRTVSYYILFVCTDQVTHSSNEPLILIGCQKFESWSNTTAINVVR